MSRILFVSENYLKQFTVVNDNVDPKLLKPAIRKAMDKYIQPVLGTNLYQTLENDVESSSGSMAANNYQTLMNTYVLPALKEWVMYELRYDMLVKWRNKGLMTQSSENGTPISMEDAEKIGNKYKDDAEFYTQRLVDYLCNYSDLYPEYDNNTNDQIQSQKNISSHGMYLGQWNGECSEDTWMK